MNHHTSAANPEKSPSSPQAHGPSRPAILDLTRAALSMSKILPVRRVGFHGHTDDDRSPESFPFPACLSSYMECIGEGYGDITIYAHNRSYTKRLSNHNFLGASGIAFGLLWSDDCDMRTLDLTQITPREETIERAFRWAGHDYTLYHKGQFDVNEVNLHIMRSIDAGIPVLAFGICGSTDCSIIAGYENGGRALVGWSHFQSENPEDCCDNGMFRLENWDTDVTSLIIPGEKTLRSLTYQECISHGYQLMYAEEAGTDARYAAGMTAHSAWQRAVLHAGTSVCTDLHKLFAYHHAILFNFAECRAWGSDFLRDAGADSAADMFMRMHDLCWMADAAAPTVDAFSEISSRVKVADILSEIAALDADAAEILRIHTTTPENTHASTTFSL